MYVSTLLQPVLTPDAVSHTVCTFSSTWSRMRSHGSKTRVKISPTPQSVYHVGRTQQLIVSAHTPIVCHHNPANSTGRLMFAVAAGDRTPGPDDLGGSVVGAAGSSALRYSCCRDGRAPSRWAECQSEEPDLCPGWLEMGRGGTDTSRRVSCARSSWNTSPGAPA